MTEAVTDQDLSEYALRLGDDALVVAQRLCEWCADAPFLEEDIAIANVGLDYLGRARLLLQYAGELVGQTEDELAYLRESNQFKNMLMLELPRGDFAFSMARQYLLDEYELLFFAKLAESANSLLSGVAQKTIKEVRYHHRRSTEWMRRLALGTDESNARLIAALDELWGYVPEFFVMDDLEQRLLASGVGVDRRQLFEPWNFAVGSLLAEIEIERPKDDRQQIGGRQGVHTEYLSHLLGEMQILQRTYPGLEW